MSIKEEDWNEYKLKEQMRVFSAQSYYNPKQVKSPEKSKKSIKINIRNTN